MITENKKDIKLKYTEVDIEGLANALALDAFNEETKDVPDADKYEVTVGTNNSEIGEALRIEKQIKPYWASNFFNLKELYIQLIRKFIR